MALAGPTANLFLALVSFGLTIVVKRAFGSALAQLLAPMPFVQERAQHHPFGDGHAAGRDFQAEGV